MPIAVIGMEVRDKHPRVLIDRDWHERRAWSAEEAAQRDDVLERIYKETPGPVDRLDSCP